MFISRAKAVKTAANAAKNFATETTRQEKIPRLNDLITKRDYTGAITVLEFKAQVEEKSRNKKRTDDKGEDSSTKTEEWLAYCAFHLGDYKKAMDAYSQLMKNTNADPAYHLYLACCYFYLGCFEEAGEEALKGPTNRLQNRILFHIAHKKGDETKLMHHHQKLTESTEDQLCLAAMHFFRSHHQDATDIYKRLLIENRDYAALQIYVALCYYKLDYHDVSLEILQPYLNAHPDSAIAINLKACNNFKIYDGKAGEEELKSLIELMDKSSQTFENDLVRHNLVVFRNGENALQILTPLIDVIPEARLNLVIYYLRNDDYINAHNLIKNLEPATPSEYILKGIVTACIGQINDSREYIKLAQQLFQLVGASATECDTIPGRQSMASCFFLLKQFDDVLVYLESIKTYYYNDDGFNYNFGIAQAQTGRYKEAEETLNLVQKEMYRNDYCYLSHLARSCIMNGRPWEAWELYLKMESNSDSFNLLILIANDCYKVGAFYYAAKAFDVLERLDPSPEYWDGKRGACVGVFQLVIADKEIKEHVLDVLNMLRANENSPQAEFIIRVMEKWAVDHGIKEI